MEQLHSILVVDDDAPIRESLAFVLEIYGYRISTACDGREALGRLRTFPPPGLILLDFVMPDMGALEFRRRQLQESIWTEIPIVLISGHPEAKRVVAKLGAIGCLLKPIDVDGMLGLVVQHCGPGQPLPSVERLATRLRSWPDTRLETELAQLRRKSAPRGPPCLRCLRRAVQFHPNQRSKPPA